MQQCNDVMLSTYATGACLDMLAKSENRYN